VHGQKLNGGATDREAWFGPFHVQSSRQMLLCGGEQVRLSGPAYNVLLALIDNAGEVVDRERLIARAWGSIHVEESSLRSAVAALRRAFKAAGGRRSYVRTVARKGYCFVEPVVFGEPVATRGGLPAQFSKIIGRDDAVADLVGEIGRYRLITIVGPGGIGKTTTALATARSALDGRCIDCAGFIDLLTTEDPALLASAVRARLGIVAETDEPMADIEAFIGNRRMLIVLDSCERVVTAVAALIEAILAGAPNVVVLATSREPLRAAGERIHHLDPLPVPPVSTQVSASAASSFPAIELFVDRATASRCSFKMTDENTPIVIEICRRLDGVPLAIEIAAGRLDSFDLPALAEVLDHHFRLHLPGRNTGLSRHRTLAATLDWSYDTLSDDEQCILRRLSVFRGPFTLEAARQIAGDDRIAPTDVTALVANLTAKSLVTVGQGRAQGKHHLLDTTRVYALDRLMGSVEAEAVARRHALYYRGVLEAAWTRTDLVWMEWDHAYGSELDQIRAALDWSCSPAGDPQLGIALTVAALPLWGHLGLSDECLARVERILALPDSQPTPEQLIALEIARAAALVNRDKAGGLIIETWRRIGSINEQSLLPRQKLQVILAELSGAWTRGRFRDCLTAGRRLRDTARATGEIAYIGVGERTIGSSHFYLGEFREARIFIEKAIRNGVWLSRAGFDVHSQFDERVAAFSDLAYILKLQGYRQRALEMAATNVERAIKTGHAPSICYALGMSTCRIMLDTAEPGIAEQYVLMLTDYATRPGLDLWQIVADSLAGALLIRRGEHEAAVVALRAIVERLRETHVWSFQTLSLSYFAMALFNAGRFVEALEMVDEALHRCEQSEELWDHARLLALRAEIMLKGKLADALDVGATFARALAVAECQGAVIWKQRALDGLKAVDRNCARRT
jgi:predicted ATPase/DNA-binding winged helix-turn-helix (wHTH) protein